ncbi:MAG: zinc metalloprotease HtpX [candidate division Zixibacteria bacterium]|nr:zinc metalloprotease HtpX [candidate division Zixibacteria bacterium]
MNGLKISVLLVGLTLIFIMIGRVVGGQGGMIIAFGLAIVMNFFSYWFSDKIVLKMYKAQPADEQRDSKLLSIVHEASLMAGLPMPRVFIIPTRAPNAFATGRNAEHAAVAVTDGLVEMMNHDELEGVIAHELAHVKNKDILIGTIAATMAGAIGILATMARWGALFGGYGSRDDRNGGIIGLIIMSLVAPLAAMVIQMAISRSREYKADRVGGEITNKPTALASALEKLHSSKIQINIDNKPATAHLFIASPLSRKGLTNLFSTHPPVEERVRRLREQANMPVLS